MKDPVPSSIFDPVSVSRYPHASYYRRLKILSCDSRVILSRSERRIYNFRRRLTRRIKDSRNVRSKSNFLPITRKNSFEFERAGSRFVFAINLFPSHAPTYQRGLNAIFSSFDIRFHDAFVRTSVYTVYEDRTRQSCLALIYPPHPL